jgi:hypothetical protein
MNGMHDLGGMHGFGPVVPEPDEPAFHAPWERRAFALTLAMGSWRRWNLDMMRFAREQMPPAAYLATSYYEHWLFGLERMLVDHGFLSPGELAGVQRGELAGIQWGELAGIQRGELAGVQRSELASGEPVPLQHGALRADGVQALLRNRRAARRDDPVPQQFAVGQAVVVKNLHPVGHTRMPRYVRGRRGEISIAHGVFVFADTHAAGQGAKPQHVYSVRFTARELWGPDASVRDSVYADLWDDYLEAAP